MGVYRCHSSSYVHTGYDQKGHRVEVQRLNFKCEINLYRLTLGFNAAKKNQTGQN